MTANLIRNAAKSKRANKTNVVKIKSKYQSEDRNQPITKSVNIKTTGLNCPIHRLPIESSINNKHLHSIAKLILHNFEFTPEESNDSNQPAGFSETVAWLIFHFVGFFLHRNSHRHHNYFFSRDFVNISSHKQVSLTVCMEFVFKYDTNIAAKCFMSDKVFEFKRLASMILKSACLARISLLSAFFFPRDFDWMVYVRCPVDAHNWAN